MKLIKFLGRAKAWLRTVGEDTLLESFLCTRRPCVVTDANDAFSKAHAEAMTRPNVLKKRREKLLWRLIEREINRAPIQMYLTKKDHTPIYWSDNFGFLLKSGYLYFVDFGFSSDSLFKFFEFGIITKEMYRELKTVAEKKKLENLLFEGEDRKQEYQRRVYDRLMDTVFNNFLRRAV